MEMQPKQGLFSHPKGLMILFFTEAAERFNYYGMRALLTLFMVKALAFTDENASLIYGNFTGLVYLTPLIGGYISDRYWGNRKSILFGGLVMAVGQFFLFGSGSLAGTSLDTAKILFWIGLLMIIIGNGFFKPNISTMVGQLYKPGDSRVDAAFSIFYMGINLGAFFAPLVCGYLGEQIGFGWGFFGAAVGMVASVVMFFFTKDKYLVSPEGVPVGTTPSPKPAIDKTISEIGGSPVTGDPNVGVSSGMDPKRIAIWAAVFIILLPAFLYGVGFNTISSLIYATSIASAGFIITDPGLTRVERQRITAIYLIAFFVIFFWAAFEQAGASLTIFADRNVNRMIGTWEMPTSYFQSINPLGVIVFAPVFALIWTSLGLKKLEPASPLKQAIGLFLLAIGYLVIATGVKGVSPDQKINMIWLVSMYMIHTFGELCLSPIGLSMVVKLAPMRLASLLMGVWFMSNAMANDLAGVLSSYIPSKGPTMLAGFQIANLYDFFLLFMIISGTASIVLFLASRYLLKLMHGIR